MDERERCRPNSTPAGTGKGLGMGSRDPERNRIPPCDLPSSSPSSLSSSSPRRAGDRSSLTVLLVDDEYSARAALSMQIEKILGHKVVAAETSEQALELYRASPDQFDAILVDYVLRSSDLDGAELLREIRREDPNIGLAMITGKADPDTLRAVLDPLDVVEVLVKPVDNDVLDAALHEAAEYTQLARSSMLHEFTEEIHKGTQKIEEFRKRETSR